MTILLKYVSGFYIPKLTAVPHLIQNKILNRNHKAQNNFPNTQMSPSLLCLIYLLALVRGQLVPSRYRALVPLPGLITVPKTSCGSDLNSLEPTQGSTPRLPHYSHTQ